MIMRNIKDSNLYLEINDYFEKCGFKPNCTSIYDAFTLYYCGGNAELQKSIDKLFTRFLNRKYNVSLANTMIDYCCNFTTLQKQNHSLSLALQATLAITAHAFYCLKDAEKVEKLLRLFFQKNRIILWSKINDDEVYVIELPINREYDTAKNLISNFVSQTIFRKKTQKENRFYTKRKSGKWVENFSLYNIDVYSNYFALFYNLSFRHGRPATATQEICNWGGTLLKGRNRCPECEKVYQFLCKLNGKEGKSKLYYSNREISQNIKRKMNKKKQPLSLKDAVRTIGKKIIAHKNSETRIVTSDEIKKFENMVNKLHRD